jgi:hypothetical protein
MPGACDEIESIRATQPKINDQQVEEEDGLQPKRRFECGRACRSKPIVSENFQKRRQTDDVIVNNQYGARVHGPGWPAVPREPLLAGKGKATLEAAPI